jgi:hypothetical protein
MADENDPIQQGASAEIKRQEDPSSPVQLELRAPYRIAAELTRIRFEMTAIRKILQGRESIEVEELKRLQGRGNIEGGTF